ncbi:DUF4890 domain-containing protein [Pontibacter liquoris]|uniref:DUF4890 domain-containing protein n=1 Tax=Pontibacter liquoris TaxID=2905677 RepID=UPI001FA72E81|nr:DUF4890 domain-containing protein [Pontibacter liquoris]
MKKIIVALALGLFVTGSTFAQTTTPQEKKTRTERHDGNRQRVKKSPEERAKLRTEKLTKELGLNNSQAKQLEALNLKQSQEMQALRADHTRGEKLSPAQREQKKAHHAAYEASLKDILTKKQYAQYQEKREQMRAQRKERGTRQGGERHQKYNG